MARKSALPLFLGITIIIVIFGLANLITDYWWFKNLRFESIFTISLEANILIFFVSAIIFFIFLMINLWISNTLRNEKKSLVPFKIKLLIAFVLSYFVGRATAMGWEIVLMFFRQVPFGVTDPIFARDVSFYVFSLPFYMLVWRFAAACIIITGSLVTLDYLQSIIMSLFQEQKTEPGAIPGRRVNFTQGFMKLRSKALLHIVLLVSGFFVLLAIRHYLSQFSIMFSEQGIVVGAGYTDVAVVLPVIRILTVLAILVAITFAAWTIFIRKTRLKKRHVLTGIIAIYAIVFLLGQTIIPGIVQNLRVSPNELDLEAPYIKNNLEFTRMAYGLDNVQEQDFEVLQELNADVVDDAKDTIDNIRILDWRPLVTTYKQTQEIRLYYDLSGIDIDRYYIDGKYTQVMIAPREMNQEQIAANAQTWVNQHLVYTHGFGVVVSPVNSVTSQGLPNYFIKDIPPVYTVSESSLKIDRPEIYYGEKDNTYVLVNTGTDEFNYPKGSENEYIKYDGIGGVRLDSFTKKLFMAMKFRDIKILLSSDLTDESRIMYVRSIQARIHKIAPFLALDKDPYFVIDDGRLYWIQDAYTVSGNYPYSAKIKQINYIRNSVKVLVDAFDGSVTFYIVDPEPIIDTYAKIFPGQFKPLEDMSDSIKKHLRYPEDLFKIQSDIYATYHMDNVNVFYNKEDAWQVPLEIYGTGQQIPVEPYYIILRLPGQEKEEFVLMSSFTPIKKDNMVSWFAARSDAEHYGKLLLYKFPKDKLIYGPSQIEAKIDQDSEISQQLTLWSQQGSRVTRGNLLVIPIKESILYIEPLYIQSEQGQLPELKRVLVSDGDRVVMEETLAKSLNALFGAVQEPGDVGLSQSDLIAKANDIYESILTSMSNQDWTGIGDNLQELGRILESLNR